MSQTFCTFVIPTIGRPTLSRAVDSVRSQFDPDWNAVVVVDSEEETQVEDLLNRVNDERITGLFPLETPGSAGLARNLGLKQVKRDIGRRTRWIGFLDDDDQLHPDYVRWLRQEDDDELDCLIFRMIYPNGRVLPDVSEGEVIRWSNVGISFAVRVDFLREKNLKFIREHDLHLGGPDRNEDVKMLTDIRDSGGRMRVSNKIAYYVDGRKANL